MYEQHEAASDEFISEEPFLLGVSFVCLFFVKTVIWMVRWWEDKESRKRESTLQLWP